MATEITIPTFDFSGFYYPELLEALIQYKRTYVPELTDESEFEPFIQALRAFALTGHLSNTLIDLVANESTLPTAQLAETVRNMLKLIDYRLSPATPAQSDIVYELSKVFVATTEVVSANAQAATKRQGEIAPLYYEVLTAMSTARTDQHSHVLATEDDVFTDYTTKANSPTTPADDWTPWATPAERDAIYWGHNDVMWDKLGAILTTPAAGITGVFEFYDGEWRKTAPDGVTDLGATLQFDLTGLLGSTNRKGTKIRVQLNQTTAYEEVYSTWNGSKNIATTGLLGQSTPSVDEADYTVGSDWTILEDVDDGTTDFTQDGDVEYPIPQTITQNWAKAEIDGKTAYWLRYRIISVGSPTSPTFIRTRMDEGKHFVLQSSTQGRTFTESPLGSSVGQSDQEFPLAKEHFLWGSETVTVDGEVWTRVDNFLDSDAASKHYVVELIENDKGKIVFGGNNKGKIPPVGVGNISATYRYGAEENGNAGASTITVDKTGLTFVNKLWNPRQATGWQEAQGASAASLERAKIEGPATIRVKDVALGPNDVEDMTKAYTDSAGASPFSRAQCIEEGYGPKTMEVVVVASGGGLASASQLAALQLHFNGDKYVSPPLPKRVVANQQVVAVNHSQKAIDITATVYGDITSARITNLLTQLIQPEATKEDGITWEWEFGDEVDPSRINHEIFDLDDTITKVVITSPAAPITLQERELPIVGTLSINVITP